MPYVKYGNQSLTVIFLYGVSLCPASESPARVELRAATMTRDLLILGGSKVVALDGTCVTLFEIPITMRSCPVIRLLPDERVWINEHIR